MPDRSAPIVAQNSQLIACLGWGSLVWDPRGLPIQREWFSDGPFIRVDFLRESEDGRMTLVLHATGSVVRSLWTVMVAGTLEEAREALRRREQIGTRDAERFIGSWSREAPADPPAELIDLPEWASARSIDAVVWTALPPKIGKEERLPNAEEVLNHLARLEGSARREAERYVRHAPRQIDTALRRRMEAQFGWVPS
jgi:hypothetical protein